MVHIAIAKQGVEVIFDFVVAVFPPTMSPYLRQAVALSSRLFLFPKRAPRSFRRPPAAAACPCRLNPQPWRPPPPYRSLNNHRMMLAFGRVYVVVEIEPNVILPARFDESESSSATSSA